MKQAEVDVGRQRATTTDEHEDLITPRAAAAGSVLRKFWPCLLVAIAPGAATDGRAAKDFFTRHPGAANPFTVLAAVITPSLPEQILLRRVLKPSQIATFVVGTGADIGAAGYLFNAVRA